MNTQKFYPYCKVLYKTEDTPGWYVAYMDGDVESVTKKCEKIWKIFKVFEGGGHIERIKDEYPVVVYASDAHLLGGWTYSNELKKWFMSGETIPKPKSKCRIARKLNIENDFEADIDTIEDKKEALFEDCWYVYKDIEIESDVTFVTNQGRSYTFTFQYFKFAYKDVFEDLFKAINENRYYRFYVEEYWYTQILVWSDDKNCRIIVQDYTSNECYGVVDTIDFIIDKKTAIAAFEKWLSELNARCDDIEKQVMAIMTDEEKARLKEMRSLTTDTPSNSPA